MQYALVLRPNRTFTVLDWAASLTAADALPLLSDQIGCAALKSTSITPTSTLWAARRTQGTTEVNWPAFSILVDEGLCSYDYRQPPFGDVIVTGAPHSDGPYLTIPGLPAQAVITLTAERIGTDLRIPPQTYIRREV